jgi:hypothetical protein
MEETRLFVLARLKFAVLTVYQFVAEILSAVEVRPNKIPLFEALA